MPEKNVPLLLLDMLESLDLMPAKLCFYGCLIGDRWDKSDCIYIAVVMGYKYFIIDCNFSLYIVDGIEERANKCKPRSFEKGIK